MVCRMVCRGMHGVPPPAELSVLSGPLYIYFETLEGDTVVATSEKKAVLTAEGVHVSAQGGRSSIGSGRIAAMNCLGDLLVDLDLEVGRHGGHMGGTWGGRMGGTRGALHGMGRAWKK